MDFIIKIIAIGILTTVATILLNRIKPEMSMFVLISGSVIIFFMLANVLGQALASFKEIAEKTNIDATLFSSLIKIIGIGYLTEFASSLMIDAGSSAIAEKVMLAGKIIILIYSLPIINQLLSIVMELII